MKTIEYDCMCDSCDGTGLYVGMAEHDGAAVVCHSCDGKGIQHVVIKYNDVGPRRKKSGIKRVLEVNPGVTVGTSRRLSLEDFGGMSYEDWLTGKKFPIGSEMRNYTCPAWWYQCSDSDKKPHWEECIAVGSFPDCQNFKKKQECWAKWDKKHGPPIPARKIQWK